MMAEWDARPFIVVASAPDLSPTSGQCDACPAASTLPWAGEGGHAQKAGRLVALPWHLIGLDEEHSAVHDPHLRCSPIVLNRAAVALMCLFQTARSPIEIPEACTAAWDADTVQAALAQMVDLGLLVSEEAAKSVGA